MHPNLEEEEEGKDEEETKGKKKLHMQPPPRARFQEDADSWFAPASSGKRQCPMLPKLRRKKRGEEEEERRKRPPAILVGNAELAVENETRKKGVKVQDATLGTMINNAMPCHAMPYTSLMKRQPERQPSLSPHP